MNTEPNSAYDDKVHQLTGFEPAPRSQRRCVLCKAEGHYYYECNDGQFFKDCDDLVEVMRANVQKLTK